MLLSFAFLLCWRLSDSNLMYYTLDVCMPRNMEAGGSRELCALWHGLQV